MKPTYNVTDESGTLGQDGCETIEDAALAACEAAKTHNFKMFVYGAHWNAGGPVEVWPGADRQDVARQIAEIDRLPANAISDDGTGKPAV